MMLREALATMESGGELTPEMMDLLSSAMGGGGNVLAGMMAGGGRGGGSVFGAAAAAWEKKSAILQKRSKTTNMTKNLDKINEKQKTWILEELRKNGCRHQILREKLLIIFKCV